MHDLEAFEGEMILADLIKIENRLERLAKEGGKATGEIALMRRLAEHLDADRALRVLELSEPERQTTSGYQFVSMKPCLALVNQPDDAAAAHLGNPVSQFFRVPEDHDSAFIFNIHPQHSSQDRTIQLIVATVPIKAT